MALYFNGNKIIGSDGTCSADKVSIDDTNLSYEADDVQEAFEKVTKSLTWEEYQALSSAEKNNGTIYLITDVNGDGQSFQPVIYSEEEREIGVWKDGKPLYEKTIDLGALPNTGPNTVAHNINSLGIVVYASGTAYNSTSKVSLPIPYVSGGSSVYNIDINVNLTNVTVTTYTDRSAFVGYIKLQYTKTTDTAGSGTWTPQGIPAVHYSTDEQVVGTWIDGSTLYEKTVVLNQSLSSDTYYTLLSDSALKLIGYDDKGSRFTRDNGQIWTSAFGYMGGTIFIYQETNGNIIFSFKASYISLTKAEISLLYTKSST